MVQLTWNDPIVNRVMYLRIDVSFAEILRKKGDPKFFCSFDQSFPKHPREKLPNFDPFAAHPRERRRAGGGEQYVKVAPTLK